MGGTARAQSTDVTDPDAVEAMVRDTVASFGGLDVLHNNAAAIALERRRTRTSSRWTARATDCADG